MDGSGIRRSHRGFSMAEVLAVIVLIGIAGLIAVPNVAAIQKSYRASELDAKAEQLYNAAQYSITTLQSTGRLDKLAGSAAGNGPFTPAGYSDASSQPTIYYACKGQPTADAYLLPEDVVDSGMASISGSYAVEFSPSAGEVYAVYYWEEAGAGQSAESFYLDHRGSIGAEERRDIPLGYYCGSAVSVVPNSGAKTGAELLGSVKAQVVNAEELYVKITGANFNKFGAAAGSDALDPDKLQVKVAVKRAESTADEWRELSISGRNAGVTGSVDELDILLDSTKENNSFRDLVADGSVWTGSASVNPGDDILVNVTVAYGDPTDPNDIAYNMKFRTNSAFAKVTSGEEGQAPAVDVKYLRHLLNLDVSRAGDSLVAGSQVRVVSDIDFDGTTWKNLAESDSPVVTAAQRDSAEGADWNPLAQAGGDYAMAPINLGEAFNTAAGSISALQNGEGEDAPHFALRNFRIAGGGESTGLFATSAVTLSGLTLYDATVTGAGNTGALTGTLLPGGSVDGCLLRGNACSVASTGGANVGALVGWAQGGSSMHNSGVGMISADDESPQRPMVVLNGTAGERVQAGGFVGTVGGEGVGGVSIERCWTSAAVQAGAHNRAGGFVGQVAGPADLNDCYASGAVTADGQDCTTHGGFVGAISGAASFSNCFSTSDVVGVNAVGAFVGEVEASAGSALAWLNCRGFGRTTGSTDLGFAGKVSVPDYQLPDDQCRFLRMVAYNDTTIEVEGEDGQPGEKPADAYAMTYEQALNPDRAGQSLAGETSFAYSEELRASGETYPFMFVGQPVMPYYGDWTRAVAVNWYLPPEEEGGGEAELVETTWAYPGADVVHDDLQRTTTDDKGVETTTTYRWESVKADAPGPYNMTATVASVSQAGDSADGSAGGSDPADKDKD